MSRRLTTCTCGCLTNQPNIATTVIALIPGPPSGVILELVEGEPLALKPNATSVLRCRWAEGFALTLQRAAYIGQQVAFALEHMHEKGEVAAHATLPLASPACSQSTHPHCMQGSATATCMPITSW